MRYKETHPWLSFEISTVRIDNLSFQFGEVASKTEHLRKTPLLPSVSRDLNLVYLTKGIKATTAIEGNSLDEALVEDIIQNKRHAPESQLYLEQEVTNILDACNVMLSKIDKQGELPELTVEDILNFNKEVLKGLPEKEDVAPGLIRRHSVVVGTVYRGAPAEECRFLLMELVRWLNSDDFRAPAEDYKVPMGIVQSVVAHIYLAWIHPFGDGNGRTARLVELYLMLRAGVPAPAAHLLSDHYNKTRGEYYRQLQELSREKQDGYPLNPFLKYAVIGYLDGIREQIKLIQDSQYQVMWKQYIYTTFDSQPHSATTKRQRALALSISSFDEPVPMSFERLNPSLFSFYHGKTAKCLQRDINKLISLGILYRDKGNKVGSNIHRILTLCPTTVK